MAEFGMLTGLAQDLQYDQRINDLYKQEQLMRQAHEESAKKAEMFANDLDYTQGANAFDRPLIKQRAMETIKKIGEIAANNPNWETDIGALTQIKLYKKDLKSNDLTLRAMVTDDNAKKLMADMQVAAKSPNQHNMDAYQNELRRYKNYEQFGNPDGEEAAKAEGPKAYLYTKPQDFIDLNKAYYEIGNKFKDMRVKTIKGGTGAYEEYANPDSLKLVAGQLYSQNKYQIDKAAAQSGVAPLDYVMAGIDAHIPKARNMGDYSLAKEMAILRAKQRMAGGGGPQANTYKVSVVDEMESQVPVQAIDAIVKDGTKTVLMSNDGKQVIDLTGVNAKNTGYNFYAYPGEVEKKFKNQKHDPMKAQTRYAEATTYIPLDKAEEMGILKKGFSLLGANFTDDEISPDFSKFAKIESKEGEDGKLQKAVKLTVHRPFDVNSAANAGLFNAEVMTSKQRPLPEENYQDVGYVNLGGQNVAIGTKLRDKKTGKTVIVTANGELQEQ